MKIGPYDYNIYANNQINAMKDIDMVPLKTVGEASVLVADVGKAQDASQIQYNKVRINGQASVYVPVLKQGGEANTIEVVNGVKRVVSKLLDVPRRLVTEVVFDQSVFVRTAIETLVHEGAIGLVLTGLMILVFLGSMRATVAVFLSIPLSALAAFIALGLGGATVNAMILGGLALAFSRLIDNSVVVLENIFRHLEMGESPGGRRRTRRRGSGLARARRDPDDGGRVFPRHLSLRREPVSVFGAGAVRGAVAVCVLLCGDVRCAALLREFNQGAPGP